MAFKLNYKIKGRRQLEGDKEELDYVDVEWRHADGPIKTFALIPVTHPPDVKYEKRVVDELDVIHDQVIVRPGTPDSIVMQICEEKRNRLAATLGVQP